MLFHFPVNFYSGQMLQSPNRIRIKIPDQHPVYRFIKKNKSGKLDFLCFLFQLLQINWNNAQFFTNQASGQIRKLCH